MRKQITSLLLTLAMLLSLVPALGVTASAAEGDAYYPQRGIQTYQDFSTLLASQVTMQIKLLKDIEYTLGSEDEEIEMTYSQMLDLNGHKITIDASKRALFANLIHLRHGNFTLYDSKGGGEIAIKFATDSREHSIIKIDPKYENAPPTFTMNGGTLTRLNPQDAGFYFASNGCISDNYSHLPWTTKRPQITINGGTINCPYDWDRSEYSENVKESMLNAVEYLPTALLLRDSELTVNGGTFNGIVWTEDLTRSKEDTEPRVSLNGGVFNYPFVVTGLPKNMTQIVIDGAHFQDGFYVGSAGKYKILDVGTVPVMLLKSGVFDSPNKNPKLDIYNVTANSYGNGVNSDATARAKLAMILHSMKCFPNSAIKVNGKFYTSENIASLVGKDNDAFYLKLNSSTPIEVIPDAWGVMESVKLDGKSIDYFKDWKGTVEEMDNSKAHTLTFQWKPLATELVNAGYSYRAKCEHYISGSTAVQKTDTIDANKTSHTVTIPKGADPKVYSYDLQLNLDKNGSSIGIISNEHIVKLVVSEAPEVKTLTGQVNYTNGAVFGKPILFSGTITPGVKIWECQFQWQRSTDGGSTWKDIPGATDGSYTPGAADMGENVRIRIVITKKGYLGQIVGAAVKVSKAANNNYPAAIQLEAVKDSAGNYTGFKITNFNSDCEYVYSTTSTPNWSANQISSATVTGLTSDTTYYVFARFKETKTHTAGSIVSKNSIRLYDYVPLQYVLLEGYDSGNTIYIKQGESVTLKVSADPSNTNSWNEITFKDSSNTTPSHITISNEKIAASTGTATPFPNNHTITITGVSKGSATLDASYPGYAQPYYGRWNVVVYDDSTVANALRLENVYAYENITLSVNDEAELPTELPKLLPENSGYHLEWRIVKVGAYGASYKTSDDNITLENGKIKLTKAHTGSEKTRLDLVAVKDNSDTYRTLPKTSLFYVTVSETPVIELTGLTLTPKKVDLEVGKTYQLSAVKEPANAEGSLTWTSSKPAVAAVDNSGKITAKGEGTATITVTCGTKSAACTVTVSKPLVPEVPGTTFTDVPAGAYYEEAVGWAVEKGITKGTSDSTFTPDGVCTRAQAVTFLWRAAGSPAAKAGSLPFADVKAGSYYDDAVRWAVENGVTVGTSATTFSPNATCSRAQIVTFLWRAQKSPAAGSANPFDDVAGNAYYADAVQWAVQKDITKGTGATAFSPDANCIRAQIVTFLYRSMK